MTSNLDEHRDEYLAEKETAEARAISERRAHQLRAIRAQSEAERPHLEAIVRLMKSAQLCEVDGWQVIVARGVNLRYAVCFNKRMSGSFYHQKVVGEQITIGYIGEKSTFPRKKDGTYSYDKIAAALEREVDRELIAAARTRQEVANTAAALRVREATGASNYQAWASGDADRPVVVRFDIRTSLTEEKAIALIRALKQLGVVS